MLFNTELFKKMVLDKMTKEEKKQLNDFLNSELKKIEKK